MSVTSGFFNSINGDRKYNAEQMSKYFDKLITSGVFPNPSTNLQVIAAEGMTINVLPGRGIIDCRWIDNDANEPLTVSPSGVLMDRIDAVVMVLDLNDNVRNCHLAIKTGTQAENPVAPTMERGTYIQEYCLAHIRVRALAEEITQADITDTRADTTICGWVTGLIEQVDTSSLFIQWQDAYNQYYKDATAAFANWFNAIKDTLTTVKMIRKAAGAYTTATDGESVIPISVDYIHGVDILNVYISGLATIPDREYTIDAATMTITLALPVDIGTEIMFEVYTYAAA